MGTKDNSTLVVSERGTYGPSILELLKTKAARIEWCAEGAKLDATEAIHGLMEKQDISKSELARRLGISRASFSAILSGHQNLTIKTIAQILYELGYEMRVKLQPLHPQVLRLKRSDSAKSAAAKKRRRSTKS